MAKDNNLQDFLTDIADAIREKKGTTDKINPQNFSNEIKSIQGETIDGNYIITKPNGRYWKFNFITPENYYQDLKLLSEEQINAILTVNMLICQFALTDSAAVCDAGVSFTDDLKLDGITFIISAVSLSGAEIYNFQDTGDYDSYTFNSGFCRIWRECDIKTSQVKIPGYDLSEYSFLDIIRLMFKIQTETDATDEEVMAYITQTLMLEPATEEEFLTARREN